MIILRGTNNVYHLKKRSYHRRHLFYKREQKLMIKMILTVFTILTIATTVYAQIPPNIFTYQADYFVTEPINIKTVGAYYEPKKLTPKETEALIRKLAKEAKFQWPDYLVKTAKCESQLDATKSNKNGNNPKNSIDRGLFMINNYWHSEVTDKQAYDSVFATKWAMDLINRGHQSEFVCDRIIKAKRK